MTQLNNSSRWKISFTYLPVRLARMVGTTGTDRRIEFIGWVWWKEAYLTNNYNYGWIAFVENQTDEYLSKCPCCKRLFNAPTAKTLDEQVKTLISAIDKEIENIKLP